MRRLLIPAVFGVLAAWFLLRPARSEPRPRPSTAPSQGHSGLATAARSHGPRSRTPAAAPTHTASFPPAPPGASPAIAPGLTEWMAVLPTAVATAGTSALNPWQDEASAAEVLCTGGNAVGLQDLDAWAEAAVWNREARGIWAVARRARGTDRVDAIRLLAERNGIDDCPLVEVLEQARGAGREAPVLAPTHGDPTTIARRDARALERLRMERAP